MTHPTLRRYIARMNRYTELYSRDLAKKRTKKTRLYFLYYLIVLPSLTFIKLFFRHKGFVDGIRGFLWSVFSAMHHPLAYFKYLTRSYNN